MDEKRLDSRARALENLARELADRGIATELQETRGNRAMSGWHCGVWVKQIDLLIQAKGTSGIRWRFYANGSCIGNSENISEAADVLENLDEELKAKGAGKPLAAET